MTKWPVQKLAQGTTQKRQAMWCVLLLCFLLENMIFTFKQKLLMNDKLSYCRIRHKSKYST